MKSGTVLVVLAIITISKRTHNNFYNSFKHYSTTKCIKHKKTFKPTAPSTNILIRLKQLQKYH